MIIIVVLTIGVSIILFDFFRRKQIATKRKREELILRQKEEEKACQWKFVNETSQRVTHVIALNKRFSFFDIPSTVNLHKICNSKREYDGLDYRTFLISEIINNLHYYEDLVNKAKQNNNMASQYYSLFKAFMQRSPDDDSYYEYYDFYEKMEKEICFSYMKRPVREVRVDIYKAYTSPTRQNSYRDTFAFSQDELINFITEAKQIIRNRETAKYQREMMTDSLRYDILKRDGFRCTICGATQADGIKLHVDHIIPVSKGGKTVPKNLRTLCDRCNFGKRDKYDPNGIN